MAISKIPGAGVSADTLEAGDIAANAITASELADDAVDTAAIAANAVTTAKITNLNVTAAKVASDVATTAGTQTLTNKTLTAPTLTTPAFTGTPSITLGSDATGDVYYRAAGGALTRLATGADGTVLTSTGAAAVPAFEAIPAGGAGDVQKDSWHLFASTTTNAYDGSNGILDFDYNVFIGSNVSESAGEITVTDAGLYLCSFCTTNYQTSVNDHDWNFRINDTQVNGTHMYYYVGSSSPISYHSNTMVTPLRLSASDTIHVYGNGYYRGDTTDSQTWFIGVRVGDLS